MPHLQQKLTKIEIAILKGLRNLQIDFSQKPLTAIMGVNGSGKTTILHAIACSYQPFNGQNSTNYLFSEFFTPNSDSRWAGSSFTLDYEQNNIPVARTYRKAQHRWSPKYNTRANRWVSYIGIRDAVPAIETLKTRSFITLARSNRTDAIANIIRINASYILNRNYTTITINKRGNNSYIGVQCKGIDYSAISMGSGEQRIFKILEQLHSAPDYALILIDEIELLLHGDALKRLIVKLDEVARAKKLQIIFTTHSEIVLEMKRLIDIKHIFIADNGNAFCLNDTNPKLIYNLTGNQPRPLSVYVEDELSREIVLKVAGQLGIRQNVNTDLFGPANNCFTAAAGAVLNRINTSNALFLMDGDLYRTAQEKKTRINAVLSGTDFASRRKKVIALKCIKEFILPPNTAPEQYFYDNIVASNPTDTEFIEVKDAAMNIQAVDDTHKYIDDIKNRLGYGQDDYRTIVNFLATLPFWNNFVQPLSEWLTERKNQLGL